MVPFSFCLSFVVGGGWTVERMTTYFLYTRTHMSHSRQLLLEPLTDADYPSSPREGDDSTLGNNQR